MSHGGSTFKQLVPQFQQQANSGAPAVNADAPAVNQSAPAVNAGGGMKGGGGSQPVVQNATNTAHINEAQANLGPQNAYAPTSGLAGGSVAQTSANTYNAAVDQTNNAMNFSPDQINAPNVNAGQVAGSDLSAYTNPYQQQVIDTSMNDLNRANQMAQNNLGANAGSAFGGDRFGIAQGETNRAFADQAARTSASLNQQGYQNAQNMRQFDIGQNYSADTFNAGNNIAAQNNNVANSFAANTNNMNGANQLANLSQQGFGYNNDINKSLQNDGNAQQNLMQQIINAANGQYGEITGFPQQMLNLPLQALGGAQYDTSETKTKNPGLFDYLSLYASTQG